MSDPLRDELLSIARAVEALKRECGMDPESPTAIQNGRYMGISYRLRALADPLRDAPAELAEAVAEVASFLIGYGDVAELAAQKLRQALREHDAALDRAPTGAAPADPELMSHDALCAALKLSGPLGREASDRIAYLSAQEDLLETAQQEAERLRQSLAEVQRPLDQQMARLNEQVIAANLRANAAEALAQAMTDDMAGPAMWRAQP